MINSIFYVGEEKLPLCVVPLNDDEKTQFYKDILHVLEINKLIQLVPAYVVQANAITDYYDGETQLAVVGITISHKLNIAKLETNSVQGFKVTSDEYDSYYSGKLYLVVENEDGTVTLYIDYSDSIPAQAIASGSHLLVDLQANLPELVEPSRAFRSQTLTVQDA